MGVAREMEVAWDELIDAFLNDDPQILFFLDRMTGEVFFVPDDYEDEAFWQQVNANPDQFLLIPGFDYDQERLLVHEFIKSLPDKGLKSVLERTFVGKNSYGKVEEILSFYLDERTFQNRFQTLVRQTFYEFVYQKPFLIIVKAGYQVKLV